MPIWATLLMWLLYVNVNYRIQVAFYWHARIINYSMWIIGSKVRFVRIWTHAGPTKLLLLLLLSLYQSGYMTKQIWIDHQESWFVRCDTHWCIAYSSKLIRINPKTLHRAITKMKRGLCSHVLWMYDFFLQKKKCPFICVLNLFYGICR